MAGAFYPADPARLRREVEGLLAAASPVEAAAPLALIVPHAGYAYSGPVAATAYAHLASTRLEVRRVLLIGPSHFAWFEGMALPGAEALATPLGEVVVSSDLSHYLPYAEACRRDEETAQAIARLALNALDHDSACGLVGVQALLLAAREQGLEASRLDLRNSGDTAGDRRRVVGYGAFALS